MSALKIWTERARLKHAPTVRDLRALFPRSWNSLTDEQHRQQRRAYVLHLGDVGNMVGVVVVQFHHETSGLRLWIHRLEIREDHLADSERLEISLLEPVKKLADAFEAPVFTLVTPERTDLLRGQGFVAWRLHRSVSVPACTPPLPGMPPLPVGDPTTHTSAPPRITDCWAMVRHPEPEDFVLDPC